MSLSVPYLPDATYSSYVSIFPWSWLTVACTPEDSSRYQQAEIGSVGTSRHLQATKFLADSTMEEKRGSLKYTLTFPHYLLYSTITLQSRSRLSWLHA
jgi:hypothetical protein